MSTKRQREPEREQYCSIRCECGKTHGNYLAHYEILYAACGRYFWALQPKREGGFILKPWPGRNLTRQEMEGTA